MIKLTSVLIYVVQSRFIIKLISKLILHFVKFIIKLMYINVKFIIKLMYINIQIYMLSINLD